VPIGSDHPFAHIVGTYQKFRANVLAGINSVFLGLAQHIMAHGEPDATITRILCGGELMYGAQLGVIQRAFPNATVIPFMFATTETGLIGLSEAGFAQNEFRVCADASLLEIMDPTTMQPIEEVGRMGLCVVTSLLRTAAPAIRMDIGDRGMWVEAPGAAERKFSIHGRRFTTQYPLGPRVLITETDVATLIAALSIDVPLLKLRLDLDLGSATVVIALDATGYTEGDLTCRVKSELCAIVPEFSPEEYPVSVQLVPFSHFESGIRRKGRLIKDNREAI
jgi:phenylacetate-CoA ligase